MSDAAATEAQYEAHLWDRRCKTVYRIRLSVLYHLKRERFFDSIDKAASMATAVAATTAVGVLLKKIEAVDLAVAGLAAVLSLVPLVFNPAALARRHGHAAAEFRRLLADAERTGQRWTEADCDAFAGRVVELEATEPAPLSALVIDCQNQLNVANGRPQDRAPLTWLERLLKHWVDFDASKIEARRSA